MKQFLRKLSHVNVGPKLPVTAWWAWRTLGFGQPAALAGTVAVGAGRARLEWRNAGELLQAMSLFDPDHAWNRWVPAGPVGTILDVGANIGQTVAYWRLRFPGARVGAVEMMPDNAARIARQAALNGWEVPVMAVAATDAAGTVSVRLSDANSRNRLAAIAADSAVSDRLRAETVDVPALPLAAILDGLGFATVDLMKVDIEGAEVNLLRDVAAWAPRVRALIIEIHDNVDEAWARGVLVAAGYRVAPLTTDGNPEWLCTRGPSTTP